LIWAVRGALLIGVLVIAALALRPSEAPPPPLPLGESRGEGNPPPQAAPTVRPTLPPEVVVSRNTRATPTPRLTRGDETFQVAAVDFSYEPPQLSVRPGTTVIFRNGGSEGHDALGGGPGGTWWSGPLAPSESFQREFAQIGSYDYVCSFHPEMRGTIVVTP
jgi:plastocyanin